MNIIVIGAGLAGAACAYSLSLRGCEVTVIAQGGGASQLPVGLLAAHLSAQDIELSQLSRIGVERTLLHAQSLLTEGIDWQPSILEQRLLFRSEKNARMIRAASQLPEWYEATENTVLHKKAAWIKPQALVKAWLAQPGMEMRDARVASLKAHSGAWQMLDAQGQLIAQAQAVVIAAGAQMDTLLAGCGHPLITDNVSGSIATGSWLGDWNALTSYSITNGNGSFLSDIANDEGGKFWASGATYEREIFDSAQAMQAASKAANHARLAQLLPPALHAAIHAQFISGQVQSWQGIRCTTSGRLPIVGELERGLTPAQPWARGA